uniref:Uncharacterized protein n=1 Tax=Noctiluca scintillans TaxID=2966 RepID=A0A7S0ZSZ2_NOCSC|mmetsp:Transcript_17263/g.46769  ORF Transcript_17263/g.46769 Transcript_17263/m.46769 type:complete len:169 (+) Transcript_17263:81-587(+)
MTRGRVADGVEAIRRASRRASVSLTKKRKSEFDEGNGKMVADIVAEVLNDLATHDPELLKHISTGKTRTGALMTFVRACLLHNAVPCDRHAGIQQKAVEALTPDLLSALLHLREEQRDVRPALLRELLEKDQQKSSKRHRSVSTSKLCLLRHWIHVQVQSVSGCQRER